MSGLRPRRAVLSRKTRACYRRAMATLRDGGVPFMVGGAYSLERYTGIVRHTKDFDVFLHARDFERALATLSAVGYETECTFPHWLGKATADGDMVDLIFGAGNGVAMVDDEWFVHAVPDEVLGLPALLCPAEETIWSKAFIMERERYDGADVAHILRASAPQLDWTRLLRRFGPHWRVLFNHLVMFGFIYPGDRQSIPAWVMRALTRRLERELSAPPPAVRTCQGTLISRAQYLVAIECWGYEDARLGDDGTMSEEDAALWTAAIATDAAASDAAPAAATIPTATATPRAS
jgi:hypothetical protein